MTIVYDRWGVQTHHGDALDVMRTLPNESVDAVVTDPQYGLTDLPLSKVLPTLTKWLAGDRGYVPTGKGFMGRGWDSFVPPPAIWDECLRVLKPGGHLLAFAATRTADLTGLAIRLAGFEYRDTIDCRLSWCYINGRANSNNALKPSHEPILLVRKPLVSALIDNLNEYGTGVVNIDSVRIPGSVPNVTQWVTKAAARGQAIYGGGRDTRKSPMRFNRHSGGRWPGNVLLTHVAAVDSTTGEVTGDACADGCVTGCPVVELDRQITDGHVCRFYATFRYEPKAPSLERPMVSGKVWPTVKPLALMRWLCKFATPPGGVILDCFAGTGTTGQAATAEGFRAILIEQDPDAVSMIRARLDGHPKTEAPAPGQPAPAPIRDLFNYQDDEDVT